MAQIVGCVAMSHGPQLLASPDKWETFPNRTKGPFNPKPGLDDELSAEAMQEKAERCDRAITILRDKLALWSPDTIVILGDDQEENILFDNMPPFTIFIGEEADATLRFRYFGDDPTDQMTRYKVDHPLALELLHGMMEKNFDPSWSKETRYEAGLGHAFGRVLHFLMPQADRPIVPLMINTYFPPAPSAKRCFEFGVALGAVLRETDISNRIAIIASGGLSHTKIDEKFDHAFIDAIERRDESFLMSIPSDILTGGTSEILNWIVVAGAMTKPGASVDYVPCYRTRDGVGCAMGFAAWEA